MGTTPSIKSYLHHLSLELRYLKEDVIYSSTTTVRRTEPNQNRIYRPPMNNGRFGRTGNFRRSPFNSRATNFRMIRPPPTVNVIEREPRIPAGQYYPSLTSRERHQKAMEEKRCMICSIKFSKASRLGFSPRGVNLELNCFAYKVILCSPRYLFFSEFIASL